MLKRIVKKMSELLGVEDGVYEFAVKKVLSNIVSLSETIAKILPTEYLSDVIHTTDQTFKTFIKSLSNIAFVIDTIAQRTITKIISEIANVAESSVFSVTKQLQNVVQTVESNAFSVVCRLSSVIHITGQVSRSVSKKIYSVVSSSISLLRGSLYQIRGEWRTAIRNFDFLHGAWTEVPRDDSTSWEQEQIDEVDW